MPALPGVKSRDEYDLVNARKMHEEGGDEILENKMQPGNGIDKANEDGGGDGEEEAEPLRGKKKKRHEMIRDDVGDIDDLKDDLKEVDCLSSTARKCRLTPKKGLLYLIVSSSIIFLLFLILIILIVLWPRSSSIPVCNSAECHYFSSKMLSGMNLTIDPCENFYEYSCDKWLETNPIPKHEPYWGEDKLEQSKIKGKLRSLINTLKFADQSNNAELKMRRFYSSCMNLEYIESDGEKPLIRMIKSMGGWEVLRTFRANDFDFPRVLRQIQRDYRASPFFHIGVVPDPRDPSKNIIKISPDGLSLPDKSYYFRHEDPLVLESTDCSERCKEKLIETLHNHLLQKRKTLSAAFKVFAKDVVQELGATSSSASQFAEKIFNYEKRIAEIQPDTLNMRDPILAYNITNVYALKSSSANIFWMDLLKTLFPQGNINERTEVLVPQFNYIHEISSIISTTDRGDLNNYLMFQLTQKFLPFMSRKFIEVRDFYLKEVTGTTSTVPRWEFCIDQVIKVFPHVVSNLLSQHVEDRPERRARVDSLFEAMRGSLSHRIDSVTRLEESMRNYALDKLRLMGIQVGTPLRNLSVLNDKYFGLDVQKDEFFTNIISSIKFGHDWEQVRLQNPKKEESVLEVLGNNMFEVIYEPSMNKVFFPEALLHKEILSLDTPHLPLIFGSVGVEIGEAIAHAFGVEKGLYKSDGTIMNGADRKVTIIREIIEQKRSCLASFFTKIKLDDEDYIERTSQDTTVHLSGIQIALDALKSISSDTQFNTLPAFENQSANALFFLAYGQSQCGSSTMLFHELEHSAHFELSHDHRVKGLLRQITTFTRAFSCGRRSYMYSDFTCGIVL